MTDKTFNDPIYHTVKLPSLLVTIINTPQFDRLRHIKQLGGSYYVFPGASNNRFEHCIGVAYLAGELVKRLQNDPDYGARITNEDVLCVQVAGLCHDIGHGPFSHAFEDFFLKKILPHTEETHERLSGNIVRQIYDQHTAIFHANNLTEDHVEVIKSLITGKPSQLSAGVRNLVRGKGFLYEIVANKFNEIDVDKWDYFTRDSRGLGIQHGFDLWRLLENASIKRCGDRKLHIVYRDKVKTDILELFHTRTMVHKRACQHKTIKAAEMMIGDAFCSADRHFRFEYYDSQRNAIQRCKLSEAPDCLDAYVTLNDSITEQIRIKGKAAKSKAAKLLDRLITRDLYTVIFDIRTKSLRDTRTKENDIQSWIGRRKVIGIHVSKLKDKLKPKRTYVYDKNNTVTSLRKMMDGPNGSRGGGFEGYIRVYHKGRAKTRSHLAAQMIKAFPWINNFRVPG